MTLAIFDLDNTLLGGDSDHAWGEFLIKKQVVDPAQYKEKNDEFYLDYEQGQLDINEFLEFALAPLAQNDMEALKAWHAEYMTQCIQPMRLKKADALLNKHKKMGHFLLIITATNRFITEPISHLLGTDGIIATDPEIINGQFTGRVSGTPCFQEGKVERLHTWLNENNRSLSGSYFYSDSHNDIPLLKTVDFPYAVDPDARLRSYAEENNWPIMSLR